jgi:hypothetical protein
MPILESRSQAFITEVDRETRDQADPEVKVFIARMQIEAPLPENADPAISQLVLPPDGPAIGQPTHAYQFHRHSRLATIPAYAA